MSAVDYTVDGQTYEGYFLKPAGKENAPKQAMVAAARARGFAPADDNEADALALLHWAIATSGGGL